MQLREVMTSQVRAISPEATIGDAAGQMADLDVGALPVAEDSRPIGILTDRDIVVRGIARSADPSTTAVRDVMTQGVECMSEDRTVHEAARLMEARQIRRILVVDAENRLRGIVSLGDLAAYTGDRKLCGEVLEKVSEPAAPAHS